MSADQTITRKISDLAVEPDEYDKQSDHLWNHLPGGIHQCKHDEEFTLISMSDGFLEMLEYTNMEIQERFQNKFIQMIYAGDRMRIQQQVQEQLKKGSETELEYRIIHKNGALIWVLDKGRLVKDQNGNESFYCLLIEITQRKCEQEELRLSLERHKVIMDQATDIIFEWDIQKDTLEFSPNWYKKFGYVAIHSHISKNIPISNHIHPEDMPAFVKIMQDTALGVPYSETEFRINDSGGQFFWCRIRATTQFDSDKKAIKAVGVITDIDAEKKHKQKLYDQAQKDALTGLYNKAAINNLVQSRLNGNDHALYHAIFILDIDYFKQVNDTYGHMVGDSLLSEFAVALKKNVRLTDLVGRIGGDEFLVYLSDVENEEAARKKARQLRSALTTIVPQIGASPISTSIGVVIFSDQEKDYTSLYKKADQALYYQKSIGRDGITIYGEEITKVGQNVYENSAIGEAIGSDMGHVMDEQLSQYAFRTLYAAVDIESTMNRLLEIIGRAYDVSRVYIFESSEDGKCCSNTFEWCNTGVDSQIEKLQNLSYHDDLEDYINNFNDKGIFYCANVKRVHEKLKNVLEPQGIQSMLQSAILDEGRFVGYVGFDECRTNKLWRQQQVDTFKLTADILSVYIIKLRQKQKIEKIKQLQFERSKNDKI